MQSVLSRNWTHIAVSISCDYNHYTTGTSCFSDSSEYHFFFLPLHFSFSALHQILSLSSHFYLFQLNLISLSSTHIFLSFSCRVGCGCRIHRLPLCRGIKPSLTSVLDMILNYLMVRFQWCWSFGECGAPLHCHRSQVHWPGVVAPDRALSTG